MSKRIVLLQALSSTPNDLAFMVRGVDDFSARLRPATSAWALADVVSHLVDVEGRYRLRFQRIVEENEPFLPYIHPDESAHDRSKSLSALLSQFTAARSETISFLKEVRPGDWQRRGIHETQESVTLRFLVQFLLDHDIQHLNQLVEIRQALKLTPKRDPQPTIRVDDERRK